MTAGEYRLYSPHFTERECVNETRFYRRIEDDVLRQSTDAEKSVTGQIDY